MLGKSKAFSGFAVDRVDRAKDFYGNTLGLKVSEESMAGQPMLTLHLAGGRDVLVYEKPDFKPATYTILNFPVDDVDTIVDGLIGRGVTMLRYDGFDQDAKGIARGQGPSIAWFTDPAGNILAVLQESS